MLASFLHQTLFDLTFRHIQKSLQFLYRSEDSELKTFHSADSQTETT
jgi:hypothetical protein